MCQICAAFRPFDPSCTFTDLSTGTDLGPSAAISSALLAQGVTITETTDASAGTGTSYAMAAGDFFAGTLESGTASDWIEVTLVAGQTYTIAMIGDGALNDGVNDTLLRLRDANGQQVATDDDDGPGRSSSLTYTPTTGGIYYIDAQTWSSTAGGDYIVSVTEGDVAFFNAAMAAGSLLRPDAAWTSTPGTGATVTWGVRQSGPATDASGASAPFFQLSGPQIQATQNALEMFESVSGLEFTQVNPGGTTNAATILVAGYQSTTDGAGAYAYYPGSTAGSSVNGDVWLNNTYVSTTSLTPGTYSYYTVLHEIGHAVGLAHPGDYNAGSGGPITYDNSAQYIQDTRQYTVMSYFDDRYTTTNIPSQPDTLLLHDIYALQMLYGANMSHNSGATTYGFNATEAGSVFDFSANAIPYLTIWDGGGRDRIDLSGYNSDQMLSLVDGTFSNIAGYVGNVSIAFGAVIEDAIGGLGDDTILGNSVANDLSGGVGADSLNGGAGDDTLMGGLGDDTLYGGDGADIARGDDGEDTIYGQAQRDSLWGGDDNDRIFGGLGFDRLYGDDGDDYLDGGGQADNVYGGSGNDTLLGSGGLDRLFGGVGDDTIFGGDANDALFGDPGADTLSGGTGNDRLFGGKDRDVLLGGDGNDSLYGGSSFDTLNGGTGDDLLWGEFNADTFVFDIGHGHDRIGDFDALNRFERIDLSAFGDLDDMDAILAASTQTAQGVLITTSATSSILLTGVDLNDLDASDFIF